MDTVTTLIAIRPTAGGYDIRTPTIPTGNWRITNSTEEAGVNKVILELECIISERKYSTKVTRYSWFNLLKSTKTVSVIVETPIWVNEHNLYINTVTTNKCTGEPK